jgi:photosystem II stability/assembly factor-like uncharacterized protein
MGADLALQLWTVGAQAGSDSVVVTVPPRSEGSASITLSTASGYAPQTVSLQYVQTRTPAGTIWARTGPAGSLVVSKVHRSANGQRVVALDAAGMAWRTSDAGATWASSSLGLPNGVVPTALCGSSDGLRLIVASSGQNLRLSIDGGVTWSALAVSRGWLEMACSADGMRLVASEIRDPLTADPGGLWVSTDGGVSWTSRGPVMKYPVVACSVDGTWMVAGDADGKIHRSVDGGVTWTTVTVHSSLGIHKVTCSADARRIYAGVNGGLVARWDARIINWVFITTGFLAQSLTCSADGQHVVLGPTEGGVLHSADGGFTWTNRGAPNSVAYDLALAADGTELYAAMGAEGLWRSRGFVQPVISSVSPSSGSAAGGTSITLSGSGFTGVTSGDLGGSALTQLTVVNDTTITATTTAHAAGIVAVTLSNPDLSGTRAGLFEYVEPPIITAVLPPNGTPAGGTEIVVVGKHFPPGSLVTIGGVAAQVLDRLGSTMIIAIAPPGTAGTAHVDLSSSVSAARLSNGYTYATPRTQAGSLWKPVPFTPSGSAGSSVLCSADGQVIVRVNRVSAELNVSQDGGATWSGPRPSGFNTFGSVAMSANGSRLYISQAPGGIGISTDLGLTWTRSSAASDYWRGMACSADGQRVIAISSAGSHILSTDGGSTWTQPSSSGTLVGTEFCMSADGLRILAVGGGSHASISTDGGQSWTSRPLPVSDCSGITCSADGRHVTAINISSKAATSSDGGLTWTLRDIPPFAQSISCTVDGQRQAIAFYGSKVRVSSDFGATWSESGSTALPGIAIAMSADGATLVLGLIPNGVTQTVWVSRGYFTPTISSITPAIGSTIGGTAITVTGSSFTDVMGGDLGGSALTNITVLNDSTLTATTSAHTAGLVSISLSNPDLTGTKANVYTYAVTKPVSSSISPNVGSTQGGTTVIVTGDYFTSVSFVFLEDQMAPFTVINDETLQLTTPPSMVAGLVDLEIHNAAGITRLANAFTYQFPPPSISSFTPSSGPTSGGTSLTIRGANFLSTVSVRIGTAAATNVFVWSPTMLTCTSPPGTLGTAAVLVQAGGGNARAPTDFTYQAPPPLIITSMSPNSGSSITTTTVTLSGIGFAGTSAVTLDGASTTYQIVSDSQLRLTIPKYNTGLTHRNIAVTAPGGTSAAPSPFSYLLEGIHQWRQTWFSSPANAGPAADTAIPYHNGLPNILVYALLGPAQNPATAQQSDLPQLLRIGDRWAYAFSKPTGVLGITYSAESNPTLSPGAWQPIPNTGAENTFLFMLPAGRTQDFARLSVNAE